MGSIGGNGATTTFSGNTMNTRVSAGNQLDSLGGGGDWDPYAMIKKLRADKEQARRSAMEWDAKQAEKADFQQNALSAGGAPPNPVDEQLRLQQATHDQNMRNFYTTKTELDNRRSPLMRYGTNQDFFNMPAAAAMSGLKLPQPQGWGAGSTTAQK